MAHPTVRLTRQIRRDGADELILRGHGLVVLRYDWDLVHAQPKLVYDDLMTTLSSGSAR